MPYGGDDGGIIMFVYLFIKLRHLQQTSGRVTNYCGPFKNC